MRRRISIAIACSVLLASSSTAADGGSDWPHFLGPTRDGKSTEVGIRTDWSAGKLPVLWQRSVGEGYSMPSIADGRLFLFDRQGGRARLICLDARSGEELWRNEYPTAYEDQYGFSNGPRASPLVDGDRVYTFGVEGKLRCHRVTDGSLLWEVDTARDFGVVQNFFGVGSSPAIEGDLLIAQVGGSPKGSPSRPFNAVVGDGSGIVAFDKKTGAVHYRITDGLASYAALQLATIGGRRWGFSFSRGGLVGFEPATGKVDFLYPWRAKIVESVNAATPIVVGDTVLITEGYRVGGSLLRVEPGGYEVVWKDTAGRGQSLLCHWSTPVYHDGVVYASSGRGSGDAELRAIDHATGKVLWSHPGMQRSTLLYADRHLVVLGENGVLYLVRATPDGFDLVTETRLEVDGVRLLQPPAWNAPVLARGILYVRGKDRLVALELIAPRPAPKARADE